MSQKIMVSAFDLTTTMAKPWAEAGYLCYCVDIQHPEGESEAENNIIKVGADILEWQLPAGEIAFAAFFPPCTHIAVSGAAWFKKKGLGALVEALTLFSRAIELAEETGAPYMIENPVSTVSTYYRKPDYIFNPHEYAGYLDDPTPEAYTKRTCLWVGNGYQMPPKKSVEPVLGSKMHYLPPSPERANLRSATPEGFARAVFLSNHNRSVETDKVS